METLRQHIHRAKVSLSVGLVLALVCFFGTEVTQRVKQQPLSVASQLWYSVAAHHSLFDKRVKDPSAFSGDLDDDAPSVLARASHTLPSVKRAHGKQPFAPTPALTRFSYQRPPLRAPPA